MPIAITIAANITEFTDWVKYYEEENGGNKGYRSYQRVMSEWVGIGVTEVTKFAGKIKY